MSAPTYISFIYLIFYIMKFSNNLFDIFDSVFSYFVILLFDITNNILIFLFFGRPMSAPTYISFIYLIFYIMKFSNNLFDIFDFAFSNFVFLLFDIINDILIFLFF